MSTMIDKFFGIHQEFIRSGLCAKTTEGGLRLYLFLMHQSERYSSRELTATDTEIRSLVGLAERTASNARKKLFEYGLIHYKRGAGGKYTYTICDPGTGKPYPGDPKLPVAYEKRTPKPPETVPTPSIPVPAFHATPTTVKDDPKTYGVKIAF